MAKNPARKVMTNLLYRSYHAAVVFLLSQPPCPGNGYNTIHQSTINSLCTYKGGVKTRLHLQTLDTKDAKDKTVD